MKKNLLTKKTAKKPAKKTKRSARKSPSRKTKIEHILRLAREIGEYASENLCVQPAQMEELEWVLYKYIQ